MKVKMTIEFELKSQGGVDWLSTEIPERIKDLLLDDDEIVDCLKRTPLITVKKGE